MSREKDKKKREAEEKAACREPFTAWPLQEKAKRDAVEAAKARALLVSGAA